MFKIKHSRYIHIKVSASVTFLGKIALIDLRTLPQILNWFFLFHCHHDWDKDKKSISFLFVVDIYVYGKIMGNFKGVLWLKEESG